MPKFGEVLLHLDAEYLDFFNKLKSYISTTRVKAAVSLNKEVIQMYWQIGNNLLEKVKRLIGVKNYSNKCLMIYRKIFPK